MSVTVGRGFEKVLAAVSAFQAEIDSGPGRGDEEELIAHSGATGSILRLTPEKQHSPSGASASQSTVVIRR
jgi:hypothetical protein